MTGHARAVLTGLAAIAVLAALVAGLPLVLYRFGGTPVPRHVPGWHELARRLASRDDGGTAVALIRDCAWLAWLLFAACVLAEAQAAVRGRRAPRLRLGGIQGAAAHLVALSALAFSAPAAIASPVAGVPLVLDSMAIPDSAPTSLTVTVHDGDCLWSIAQRYLGAGDRYPEIARLNYGREMGNGDVFANPSLIYPGWRLLLPSGAETGPAHGTAPVQTVQHPGHDTRDPHYRRQHHGALPQEGNGVASTAAVAPARAAGAGSPAADGAAAPRTAAQQSYQTAGSAAAQETRVPGTAVFVTGVLAGAVLASLTRLRFRQHQERRRGRRIALPTDARVLATEQRLRAASAAEPLQSLRGALACLEAGLLAAGQELPDIVGVHVTADLLEILLTAPPPEAPPAPYQVSPGRQGMCWQLALPAVAAQAMGAADCHLLPGLATVGATGEGYLLLDLEALQVTSCDGPPELVDHVIATIATELATGQWSGWYELILVGCDELAPLGRAEHRETLDEALSMLEARCVRTAQRAAARTPADVRELRLAEPDSEDWTLAILVSRVEPSAGELTRLLDLAVDNWGGIAALVAGDVEASDGRMAPAALQLAPDPDVGDGIVANVVPLQITVRPRVLSASEYSAIGTLFAAAADLGDVAPDEDRYAGYGAPPWIPQAAALGAEQGPGPGWADEPDPGEQPHEAGREQGMPPPDSWPSDCRPESEELATSRPGVFLPGQRAAPAALAGATSSVDGARPAGAHQADGADQASSAPCAPGESGRPAPGRLEVGILGPLAVAGAAEPLLAKQAELVLALALAAPGGLSNSALRGMLGADPDHPKPGDAVRQIITRARRRLGPAADGQEQIVHAGNGQYLLHPDATLDWSRFRELVSSGRADDLRAALALVRGQPFAGSYFWWIDIPLIETVRAEIVDAAEALAEAELVTGSPRAAARAARAGLLAEPSAEQLWRAVMRAEHAAGNLAGVAEAWRRCLDAIEDVAPGGEPHPDTTALYRRLAAATRDHAPAH